MHLVGLLLTSVILLGRRGRPRNQGLLLAALALFGALALLQGRPLELWQVLMGLTAWGADGCSAVVDGLSGVLDVAGWVPLGLGLLRIARSG